MPFSPVLLLHILAGTVGLVSGTIAVVVRKGSRMHLASGIVFAVSMLILAASGVFLAYMRSQIGNIVGGVLTLYMIATGWRAGRRRTGQTGAFDWVALLFALAVGTVCITYGFNVATGRVSSTDGVPAGMEFFLGAVILLAAAGDIRMLVRGGISGRQRIGRHLWRMCFGLFIASGSFFMGRQRIFPEFIRNSGTLIFLTVLPLMLLIFWMIRVRFTNLYKGKPFARSREV